MRYGRKGPKVESEEKGRKKMMMTTKLLMYQPTIHQQQQSERPLLLIDGLRFTPLISFLPPPFSSLQHLQHPEFHSSVLRDCNFHLPSPQSPSHLTTIPPVSPLISLISPHHILAWALEGFVCFFAFLPSTTCSLSLCLSDVQVTQLLSARAISLWTLDYKSLVTEPRNYSSPLLIFPFNPPCRSVAHCVPTGGAMINQA